jgi:ferric-dicitrate binding protein FerR (iron transport regulator)
MERDALVAEVLELATACQTGQASEDERARLERLLEDSAEARSIYLRIADDTVTLNDVRQARFAPSTASGAAAVEQTGDAAVSDVLRSPRLLQRWTTVAAVAAGIGIVAFGLGMLRGPAGLLGESNDATFARIVSISDVRWTDDEATHAEWERIGVDQALQFESGSVEVLYDNGVQFVVQGPANCRFISEQRVEADSGKFVARVSPDAIGFEIVTPHAKVIDLGTSFGVTIDPNRRTDVVVYEGMVDLLPDHSPNGKRRLEAGEAMSIRSNGQVGRIATVRGGEFLPPPRVPANQADENQVIASVTDNLKFSDTASYYRVVAGGFREDCPAYVDRVHQWNGLDERGIPPFLRRGDYVMTFNDDKTQHNLRIAVELAQPARLYLLVDDRAAKPQWLTDSFTDTGWDIGIDEGFADVEDVETAIGAGRSIEWTFSVWSRDVTAPSTVLLGSLQQGETAAAPREVLQSMYGIVATPLVGTVPAAEGPATTD